MAVPFAASLTPEEAVTFFRKKGLAASFNWKDVWQEEHAVAFTVAKAMRVDILEDIRDAVDRALTQGIGFSEFKKHLAPILQAKGWWGQRDMLDPLTGKMVNAQLGSTRRLKTIFDTNLRMSHAAGRWQQILRNKKTRPYLRYVAVLDGKTRDEHRRWHGTILPVEHPFWETHYPPNGWYCRCIIMQLSEHDLKRYGWKVSADPQIKTRQWTDNRSGQVHDLPEGISPGFAYNVGNARLRAFTPPPSGGGLPNSFPPGVDLPSLPAPRPLPASRLLPDTLSEDDYISRFLSEFDKPVFVDKAGENLAITRDLFRYDDGTLKATRHGRASHLLLLADTLKSPDEIWWYWSKSTKPELSDRWYLRRRYIARWNIEGSQHSAVTVFDWGTEGWAGVSTFNPAPGRTRAQDNYLKNQRGGTLAWRRKE